jgi:hypothetical protein
MAAALLGDSRYLDQVAAEMARMGYGNAADNLQALNNKFRHCLTITPPQ